MGTGQSFLFGSCHGIGKHIYRTDVLAGSLSVVRTLFVRCTLAGPFNVSAKLFWPKSIDELKSITTIFSHNLLILFALQQFSKALTGQ